MNAIEGLLNLSIADYVFFPVHFLFAQESNISDRILELALQCLDILLNGPWRMQMKPDVAAQMFLFLTVTVGGSPVPGNERKERSEECLVVAVKCLNALFQAIRPGRPAAKNLEDAKLLPTLGQAVLSLLELLETADSPELQTECLDALRILLGDIVEPDALLTFLPGTVSQICKFLAPNSQKKRPYRNLAAALRLLSQSIVRVLSDSLNSDLPDIKQADSPRDQSVKRSKAWLSATAGQIKIALEAVSRLRTHRASAVRMGLLQLCQEMLDSCSTTLKDCIPLFVDNLVVLASDKDEEVAARANSGVLFAVGSSGDIKDSLQESVHKWVSSLPRIMQSNDEDAKSKAIKRISVGFSMMGSLGINSEVVQDMLARNIVDSLSVISDFQSDRQVGTITDVVEMETSMDLVLSSNRHIETPKETFPEIIMPYKSQKETLSSLRELLKLMGSSSTDAVSLVQRHLNQLYGESEKEKSISLWIALNLMHGMVGDTASEYESYLDLGLIEGTIERRISDQLLSVSLDLLSDAETEEAPSEKLQCLAVESVALIAKTNGAAFRETFVESLYTIVHLLGSPSPLVQNHAVVALNLIASATKYDSAQALIVENSDYLLNAISLKLSFSELSPQAPLVLRMLLKISGSALIPHLDDVVAAIFSALDSYHGYEKLVALMFSVLEAVCEEGTKSLPDVIPEKVMIEKRLEEAKIKPLSKQNVLDMFTKAFVRKPDKPIDDDEEKVPHPQKPWGPGKKKKEIPKDPFEAMLQEDEQNEADMKALDKHVETPKPSKIYSTLLKIVNLTPQYLTSPSAPLRARLLSLIATTVPALATRENDFLPIVHAVWPLVSQRLILDPDRNVRREAARAIRALCIYAGTFVRQRVKEGWDKYKAPVLKDRRIEVLEGFVLVGAEVDAVVTSLGEEEVGRHALLRKAVGQIGGWVIKSTEDTRVAVRV